MSLKLKGIGASDGVAIGPVVLYQNDLPRLSPQSVSKDADESLRLEKAISAAIEDLRVLHEAMLEKAGVHEAEVFTAHRLMLEDPEWKKQVLASIQSLSCDAAYAVQEATDMFAGIFKAMPDEYMQARAADMQDVGGRVIKHLLGLPTGLKGPFKSPVILVAKDFTPSETAQFTKDNILAMVTSQGNATSHAAIIARTMGIPAVVGAMGLIEDHGNLLMNPITHLAIDGQLGQIIINPNADDLVQYQARKTAYGDEQARLESVRGQATTTLDGKTYELVCNIAKPKDAQLVIDNDGEGVGLFRSEFLFMDRDSAPSEDEQFEAYKTAAQTLNPRPLIIRTLDAGGDKHIPYLNIEPEENPFLGYRAIRICLNDLVLFKSQLRAILRASAFGKINIMFPMVTSIEELKAIKQVWKDTQADLDTLGIAYDPNMQVGIMVEIPSTAAMADVFAKYVDFFSIGTNDLTQYTLACDRMNPKLSHLYNAKHPAVIRLIDQVIRAAHQEGKWVGVCGESASDPQMIPLLVGMGLDEFSVSPSAVLKTRDHLAKLDTQTCKDLMNKALTCETTQEIIDLVTSHLGY